MDSTTILLDAKASAPLPPINLDEVAHADTAAPKAVTAREGLAAYGPELLDAALRAAADGFRVFRLLPGDKKPAFKGWQKEATRDLKKIRALWTHSPTGKILPYNIGIATGDGLFVLDIDTKDGKTAEDKVTIFQLLHNDLPETVTVETTSGGQHRYFRTNERIGNPVGKLGAGLDIRGDGGLVVGEGSVIRVGDEVRHYKRKADSPTGIAEAPQFLVDAIKATSAGSNRPKRNLPPVDPEVLDIADAEYKALDYLQKAPPAIQYAGGDKHTFNVACGVLDFVPPETALEFMLDWNEKCDPPWSLEDLKAKVQSAVNSRQDPIGSKAKVKPEAEFEPVEVADRRAKPFDADQPAGDGLLERIAATTRFPSYFKDKPIPQVDWLVPNFILDREVTLFSGHGGTGKSTIALQLGVALATGQPWLGVPVAGVKRLLYLSAEDGERRIHRRLASILTHYGLTWDDLHDRLAIVPWRNPVIGAPGRNGMEPTPFARALEGYIAERGFDVIVLDNLADIFAGNEVDRVQVTQFIGILNGLVDRRDLAILMLGHPSVRGKETGTGESGSTGWHNKVRSRLYLSDSDEKRDGTRKLESLKQQDGAVGQAINVRWSNGAFAPTGGYSPEDIAADHLVAESRFLELLDAWTNESRFVNETPGLNYAPKRFIEDPRVGPVTKHELTDAMNRLFAKGEIRVEEYTNSHRDRRKRLVRSDGSEKS